MTALRAIAPPETVAEPHARRTAEPQVPRNPLHVEGDAEPTQGFSIPQPSKPTDHADRLRRACLRFLDLHANRSGRRGRR